jgi:hypothetical protein
MLGGMAPQELAGDLERFLKDEPIRARRLSLGRRLARWGRRHKPVVASLLSVAAMLVVAVVVGALLYAARASQLADERVSTNQAIGAALNEAIGLEAEARATGQGLAAWARVRELARRAETLAESRLADPELVARVRKLRNRLDEEEEDRGLLTRLQEAPLQAARVNPDTDWINHERVPPKLEAVFRDLGIDRASMTARITRKSGP